MIGLGGWQCRRPSIASQYLDSTMTDFTSEDFIKALEKKCDINQMQGNITISTKSKSIVIECFNGVILGQVYYISQSNIDNNQLRALLKEIWDAQIVENLRTSYPAFTRDATKIKIKRERGLKIKNLNINK